MKKKWKSAGIIALVLIMVAMLLPLGSFKAFAKEGEVEPEVLGATYKVGDIIKFGKYEQDGNTSNGKEDIEWQVLKVESGRVLVVSKYALDCKPYNTEYANVTWETCSLRKWLNNDFKDAAFTSAEQAKIPTINIANKNNPKYGTAGGNNTNDQIFCLSLEETESYFGNYSWYNSESMYGYNQNLICTPTQYAENNGAYAYTITEDDYNSWLKDYGYTHDVIGRRGAGWWLRSPGYGSRYACSVSGRGSAGAYCDVSVNFGDIAVRPALFLNLSSVNPQSIKLNKTSATMYSGNEITLIPTLTPANVTEKTITWASSNPAVATVSNGVVKAKSAGTATISAKTVNGLSAKCEVTVFIDNASGNIFADVKYDSWMYAPAKAVYEKGYMTGKGTLGKRILFDPNSSMSRSQFVTALYSMEGKPAVTYEQKFSDVKNSDWFASAVTWASNNGIVAGNPDGTFGVNGKATREQMALMLMKYAKFKGKGVMIPMTMTLDKYKDADKVDDWALFAVKWAVYTGIITGKGNETDGYRIDPTGKASRIECAAMLNKFYDWYTGASLSAGMEDTEEPLALPEEENWDISEPGEDIEDIIIIDEEDVIDDVDEDNIDEGDEDNIDDGDYTDG
ncbi:MAG: S-layer homology domain-containing protein [Lachnospiraceae bacterium]|nr:S-layer homology domain-containing protein [Lachnospiraceae bacterium]